MTCRRFIDKALAEMGFGPGGAPDPSGVNLSEFARLAGLTRSKARTIRAKGFRATEHGRCGQKAKRTVMTGHEAVADELLRRGVTNSSVVLERLRDDGYEGGLSSVKDYIRAHAFLVPAKRKAVAPQGNRGRRFATEPGEAFQMDWGFVSLADEAGETCRIACFCMVCHHCGTCYVEFFPNARQENLFIGMAHAFMAMGVPEYVLTDNMRSVVVRRDADGRPVWQADYAAFMSCVGFRTRLCKPRHPFTKGKVERLVRYVKENFLAGREFRDLTRLNAEALAWCARQGGRYRRAVDCVPADEHAAACLPRESALEVTDEVSMYLCPRRRVSFDGFVAYEGRRFGVPYWYGGARRARQPRGPVPPHIQRRPRARAGRPPRDLGQARQRLRGPVGRRAAGGAADAAGDHPRPRRGSPREPGLRQVRLRGEAVTWRARRRAPASTPR